MKKILIGKVLRPQGIKGELKIKPFVDSLQELKRYKEFFLGDETAPRKVVSFSARQEFLYLSLSGVQDRNSAELFRNKNIYLNEEDVKNSLEKDEYLIEELIGFAVFDNLNNQMGVLEDIENFGSADVYTIKTKNNFLRFPNIQGVIEDIDEKNKKIILNKKRLSEVAVYED